MRVLSCEDRSLTPIMRSPLFWLRGCTKLLLDTRHFCDAVVAPNDCCNSDADLRSVGDLMWLARCAAEHPVRAECFDPKPRRPRYSSLKSPNHQPSSTVSISRMQLLSCIRRTCVSGVCTRQVRVQASGSTFGTTVRYCCNKCLSAYTIVFCAWSGVPGLVCDTFH